MTVMVTLMINMSIRISNASTTTIAINEKCCNT